MKYKRIITLLPIFLCVVLVFLFIQPIHSKKICAIMIALIVCLIIWIIYLSRNSHKLIMLIGFAFLVPIATLANWKNINTSELRKLYIAQLNGFLGTGYIWGGEGFMGIDCSGLPRKSMINALAIYGMTNFNGRSLVKSFYFWWNDASASELLDGYSGETLVLNKVFTPNDINNMVQPGDMAVTVGGIHVMVYLDKNNIIQADPGRGSVNIDKIPTQNSWYDENVKLVKWNVLK